MLVKKVTLVINTGCTKGDVLTNEAGAGFTQADAGDSRPFVVARETVVAPTDGSQATCMAIVEGHTTFNKVTGTAINELQPLKAADAGKVTAAVPGTDLVNLWVGYAWIPSVSGATTAYGVIDQ